MVHRNAIHILMKRIPMLPQNHSHKNHGDSEDNDDDDDYDDLDNHRKFHYLHHHCHHHCFRLRHLLCRYMDYFWNSLPQN